MLSICLWKKWREHRGTFFWLLAIALSVQILLVLVLPEFWVGPRFVRYSLLAWSSIAVLLYSTSLVQLEYRSQHEGFPSRLPLAESQRFYSKVLLLVILVVSLLFFLGSLMIVALWARGVSSSVGLLDSMWYLPVLLSGGLLLMGAACWLPRSALVHPMAAMLFAIVTLPFSYAFIQRTWVEPGPIERLLYLGLLFPLLCLLVARWSAMGMHVSAKKAFMWGGGAFTFGLCGLSFVGVSRMETWDRFDPLAPDAQIESALIGMGGKYAFVNARRRNVPRTYALIVDLETGGYEQVGDGQTRFASAAFHDRSSPGIWSLAGEHSIVMQSRFDGRIRYRNGLDTKIIEDGQRRIATATMMGRMRESLARVAFLRTNDDEKVWFLEGFEKGQASDPQALPWKAGRTLTWPLGCSGIGVPDGYYDLHRVSFFRHPDDIIKSRMSAGSAGSYTPNRQLCAITAAGWILQDSESYKMREDRRLFLHNPETGEERLLTKLPPGTQVIKSATFTDGRLVLLEPGGGRTPGRIVIYDPRTNTKVEPKLKLEVKNRVQIRMWSSLNQGYPVRTPAGRILFTFYYWTPQGLTTALLALDPITLEIDSIPIPSKGGVRVLACPDESQVLLLLGGSIQRFRWGQKDGEKLFPRPVSAELVGGLVK